MIRDSAALVKVRKLLRLGVRKGIRVEGRIRIRVGVRNVGSG